VGATGLLALQWQRAEYEDPEPPFGQAYRELARVAQREFGLAGWHRIGPTVARLGGELRRKQIRADALTHPSTNVHEAGLWAQVEIDQVIGVESVARVALGLRADRHDLLDGARFSPSLSASYETRGTRIEVSFRDAFAPPGLADLFFQEGVLVRPNPELRPERVRSEVAATLETRIQLGRSRIQTRLAAYEGDIDDMILWFPDFQFVWSPNNVDVSRRGMEVGSTVELPFLGQEHRLSGQAAWTQVEYGGSVLHGQVAYRPVFSANAEGRFDLPFGNLTLSANHVGTRRSVPGSDLNSLSPYTIVNLGWSSPVGMGWVSGRIELVFSNILDERAALLVDYPLPSRGWSTRLHLTPTKKQ
jgi:iron complex outermembrane receptor protein